jgi:hypothetical protein
MARGIVCGVDGDHAVVHCATLSGDFVCDVLRNGGYPERVAVGDTVLVCVPAGDEENRAVVIGRIGLTGRPDAADPAVPDELLIEARRELTLKCGDGSITIRADGKILIKGKELVSHAQKMNRIKGGAVAIN